MSWSEFIKEQKELLYFQALEEFLEQEVKLGKVIYPPLDNRFNAFMLTKIGSR